MKKAVVVMAEAEHLCMKMRGVKNDLKMTTIAYRGIYQNREEKESIVSMIHKAHSESFTL